MTPHFFLVLLLIPLQVLPEGIRWEADTGMTARLECNHSMNPVDYLTWDLNVTQIVYKDKKEQKIAEGYDLEASDGKVYLIIKKVKKSNAGIYVCSVFNVERGFQHVRGELHVKAFSTMTQSSLAVILSGLLLHMVLLHL